MDNKQIKITIKHDENELQLTVPSDIDLESLYTKFDLIALFLTYNQSQINCTYMQRADELRKEID